MQKSSSQAALNPCCLVDVAKLCHVLMLKKNPQLLKETSHDSPGVFTCFNCEKAKIPLETSASVLNPNPNPNCANSLHGPLGALI